jgi:hypothetical protein
MIRKAYYFIFDTAILIFRTYLYYFKIGLQFQSRQTFRLGDPV